MLPKNGAEINLAEERINGMAEMGFRSTGEMRSAITLFKSADHSPRCP